MQKKAKMIKLITVVVLALSLGLFFLPYLKLGGDFYNPVQILELISDNRGAIRSDATFEVVFSFIVPVGLTALSAFIMIFKPGVPKSVICAVLNALAVGIYLLFFSQTFFDTSSGNVGFGLTGNIIIACLGIILPIVVIVIHKKALKDTVVSDS